MQATFTVCDLPVHCGLYRLHLSTFQPVLAMSETQNIFIWNNSRFVSHLHQLTPITISLVCHIMKIICCL